MIVMSMPSDLPHEPSEIAVKLAAAQAAQATAAAAQVVADECQKSADEAMPQPSGEAKHQDLREQLAEATQHALHLLRKISSKP